MNHYEITGFIASLICVWLNIKANIWGWFWAIIGSLAYIFVFAQARLYADMSLQFFFIAMSIYGYWAWKNKLGNDELMISKTPIKIWIIAVFCVFILAAFISYILKTYTNSELTYLDAFTTSISLIAQWLMARKYLENWLFWIFADVVYVALYFYKELYITSLLYGIFLILATMGYFEWKQKYQITSK